MTDNTSYDEYFDSYRRKSKALDDIRARIDAVETEHRQRMDVLNRTRHKLSTELEGMRRVITTMIDEGVDPVEAKLKVDSMPQINIWDINHKSEISWDAGSVGVAGAIATVSHASADWVVVCDDANITTSFDDYESDGCTTP